LAELSLLEEVRPSLMQLLICTAEKIVGNFHPLARLHDESVANLDNEPLLMAVWPQSGHLCEYCDQLIILFGGPGLGNAPLDRLTLAAVDEILDVQVVRSGDILDELSGATSQLKGMALHWAVQVHITPHMMSGLNKRLGVQEAAV
jgi:hypothetical protein